MTTEIVYGKGSEDFSQAEWLAVRMRGTWRYDHTEKRWHHYDGIRWAEDKTNRVIREGSRLAADALVGRGMPRVEGEEERKALKKLLNIPPLERALVSLATFDGYGTDGSDWDQDPYLLGCKNGIVDLRENAIVPSSPEQKVTKSTGVDFHPITDPTQFSDRAPRFMEFIEQVTSDYDWSPDIGMVSFLLLWFGASLFGMSPEQRFLLMTGSGRNGKGALKHAILSAIGDYGAQPDANLYSRTKFGPAATSSARADLMAIKGKRVALFSEPDRGQFNEEMLKAHTGGDMITARALYSNRVVSWEPTHSITFLVNDAPNLDDVGPSMGSRIMVADFRHRFEGANEDKSLYDALKSEREGILAILCWAAQAWYTSFTSGGQGITLPPRVIDQSRAFIERNDPIADCLREVFVVRPDVETPSHKAYEAYLRWHARSGREDEAVSQVKFAAALEKKGMRKVRRSSGIIWIGMRAADDIIAEASEDGDGDE